MSKNTQKLELDHTKDGVRKYWNQESKFYDNHPGFHSEEELLLWKNYLLESIGTEPKKVLDVGTGTGIIAMLLYELGHSVTGVDFSMDMMSAAKKKAVERGVDIKFFEGDVENLQFKDGTFDCVTARWVLWTMAHPEKAVQEWARVVKPGGKVVIIDGEWINKGLLQKISIAFYRLYCFVKFGNNLPAGYENDIRKGIPNPHGVKKEQIMGYMSGAGLIDISVTGLQPIRAVQRKHMPLCMKPKADHPSYLVSGRIPEKRNRADKI